MMTKITTMTMMTMMVNCVKIADEQKVREDEVMSSDVHNDDIY